MIIGGRKSVAFLVATSAVLGWEVYASWDGSEQTTPWTDLVVTYIPGEITAALLGGLLAWLPVHFGIRYWRKRQQEQEQEGES